MRKFILTSLLLFSSLFILGQTSKKTDYFEYKHEDGRVDSMEVSIELIPMVANFIEWSIVEKYDISKRFGDIKGIYYVDDMHPAHMGETLFYEKSKDIVRISSDIKLYEVLNIVVFHEMFHVFSGSIEDHHCMDESCSSIMFPAVNGYLSHSLCNWKREVKELFTKLKTIEPDTLSEDHIKKCKLFNKD